MALSTTIVLEVRSATGSDTNGGGFDSATAGTDYSQQASAQIAVTDAVANGTTTITSATAGFGSTHVGSVIYLAGGSNSLAATRRQVASVTNGTTIVVDATVATGTGITLNLGGALATLNAAVAIPASLGNIIWCKGAFTPAGATISVSSQLFLIGYGTTRGDGVQATIDATGMTAATNCVTLASSGMIKNFAISNAKNHGVSGAAAASSFAEDVTCTSSGASGFNALQATRCRATSNTANGFLSCYTNACNAELNAVGYSNSTAGVTNFRSVARANTSHGFQFIANGAAIECDSYGNGGHGFYDQSGINVMAGNISYGNTLFQFNFVVSTITAHFYAVNNFAGGGGSGNTNLPVPLLDDGTVTALSADPFVNATNAGSTGYDFGLNSTAGGGALCRAAGFPSSIPGIVTTGYPDAGVFQHQDAGGASPNYGIRTGGRH